MAARRYETSQRTSEIFFQHEKRNFVSPSGHVTAIALIFFIFLNLGQKEQTR